METHVKLSTYILNISDGTGDKQPDPMGVFINRLFIKKRGEMTCHDHHFIQIKSGSDAARVHNQLHSTGYLNENRILMKILYWFWLLFIALSSDEVF